MYRSANGYTECMDGSKSGRGSKEAVVEVRLSVAARLGCRGSVVVALCLWLHRDCRRVSNRYSSGSGAAVADAGCVSSYSAVAAGCGTESKSSTDRASCVV